MKVIIYKKLMLLFDKFNKEMLKNYFWKYFILNNLGGNIGSHEVGIGPRNWCNINIVKEDGLFQVVLWDQSELLRSWRNWLMILRNCTPHAIWNDGRTFSMMQYFRKTNLNIDFVCQLFKDTQNIFFNSSVKTVD